MALGRVVPDDNLEQTYMADMSSVLVLAWDYSYEESVPPMGCIQHRGLELVNWKAEEEGHMMLVVLAMVDRETQLVLDQRVLVRKETQLVLDQWVLVERHSWEPRSHNWGKIVCPKTTECHSYDSASFYS